MVGTSNKLIPEMKVEKSMDISIRLSGPQDRALVISDTRRWRWGRQLPMFLCGVLYEETKQSKWFERALRKHDVQFYHELYLSNPLQWPNDVFFFCGYGAVFIQDRAESDAAETGWKMNLEEVQVRTIVIVRICFFNPYSLVNVYRTMGRPTIFDRKTHYF